MPRDPVRRGGLRAVTEGAAELLQHGRIEREAGREVWERRRKPLLWSLASGLVWIGVAGVIGYAVSPVSTTPLDVARTFAGGIVAAPVIGLLLGHIARRFSNMSHARRIWVALRDLYLAAYLFLLATGVGQLVGGLIASHHVDTVRSLMRDPLLGTVLGLTYTGFVVVLLPLSYANHVLLAKAWDHAGG